MEKLHRRSGVFLNNWVDLQNEWRSAKAAIFKSYLHFITGKTPYYRTSVKELLTGEHASYIEKFIYENENEVNRFYEICRFAKKRLREFFDLSELFVYYVSIKMNIEKARYQFTSRKYGLNFSGEGDRLAATRCLNIVNLGLRKYLADSFPGLRYEAVCWGFELPASY
jgi:hypothetical protein